jgi:hypothetical protein
MQNALKNFHRFCHALLSRFNLKSLYEDFFFVEAISRFRRLRASLIAQPVTKF